MNWTPEKQQQFAIELDKELQNVTMSWSKELRAWHHYAMEGLKHASIVGLKVSSENYNKLFTEEAHGLNMNVIMVLANNLEYRTPAQLGIDAVEMMSVVALNVTIGAFWEQLAGPVKKAIEKRMEIMDGKKPAKLVLAN